MKGFLYLVEIVVAGVLIAIIFGGFFAAQNAKSDWGRADLIALGNNIFDTLGNDATNVLSNENTFDVIDSLKPVNVQYTIRFTGIPKSEINVGTNDDYVGPLLTDAYVNGRYIKFNVKKFGTGDSLDNYDIIVTHDFDYTDSRIINYVETKKVVGIGGGTSLNSFFGLQSASGKSESTFYVYNDITKYFSGIGFIVDTPIPADQYGNKKGYVKFLDNTKTIIISSNMACIGDSCTPSTPEGGFMTTQGVKILVKKIDYANNKVYLGAVTNNYKFKAFIDIDKVGSTDTVTILGDSTFSTMTQNGNAIWISDFDDGEDYKTLVKSAVASSVTDWYMGEKGAETVEVPRFIPLCCDIPETAKMSFVMWYVY
ncbi:MAG: hypothetical protein PHU12_01925 [Candidatus Aenigmarchaeota archaeon]|nr:hypothetical protein [Candidatus Aenigmarchaeota archaeon]